MTSQLVLINQAGVAAASDTLSTQFEPHGEIKTIPSNSKIHGAGADHLVAVLHCGSTFLGGLHWSSLVREWSLSLTAPLPHLNDYADDFCEWIATHQGFISFNEARMVGSTICHEYGDLLDSPKSPAGQILQTKSTEGEAFAQAEFEEALGQAIESYMKLNFTAAPYGDLTASAAQEMIRSLKIDLIGHFSEHTKAYGEFTLTKKTKRILERFATELLIRFVPSGQQVDLNFVGFGTEDLFGGRVCLSVRSFYAGQLRYARDAFAAKEPDVLPAWYPLAQADMIWSFIYGIDLEAADFVQSITSEVIQEKLNLTDDQLQGIRDAVIGKVRDHAQEEFVGPFSETIEALGIASLTRLAELLVRFQCLRAASLAREATVGGYVESLQITRDRGVEWQRRISVGSHSIEDASHVFA